MKKQKQKPSRRQTPYLCPVCMGKGLVPSGFYTLLDVSSSASPEQCKPCAGTGIVWGVSDVINNLKNYENEQEKSEKQTEES